MIQYKRLLLTAFLLFSLSSVFCSTPECSASKNRNKLWKIIWNKKGKRAQERFVSHAEANGYDSVDPCQLSIVHSELLRKTNYSNINSICEFGCGSGGVLVEVEKLLPDAKIFACDYSENLLAIAKKNFAQGTFWVQDITVPFEFENFLVDLGICYGVLLYLDSEIAARTAIMNMVKHIAPQGQLLIGEVNDSDKKEIAFAIRNKTHENRNLTDNSLQLDHLYLPKSFFIDIAEELNAQIEFISYKDLGLDFEYLTEAYRYNVLFTFN